MNIIELDANGFATESGFIHVYHIDPLTNEYTTESDEYISIGASIPAHSVIDKPLQNKSGFSVIWDGEKWLCLEDNRGVITYSISNRSLFIITELGPIPDNVTIHKPFSDFDEWDGEKWVTNLAVKKQADIEAAENQKSLLLLNADTVIERLKDNVALGMATDEETERYTAWRKYRVLLSRVDTSKAPDIEWPQIPE